MLCYAVIVLGIKLLPLVFAIAGSFRARFWLGLGIASVAVYCLVAATLRAIPPHPQLPLGELFTEHPLALVAADAGLSLAAAIFAYRRARAHRDNLDLRPHYERAGGGFVGNMIIDVAIAVAIALGFAMTSE